MRFGWWTLLLFLSLGAILEALHGFRVQAYLSEANDIRRLLWTLAHAHGTLLAVINILFGLSLPALRLSTRARAVASRCLYLSALLLPAGFFLGGAFHSGIDPGLGILLVPIAVVLVTTGVFLAARAA